jgi:hypothetical protein
MLTYQECLDLSDLSLDEIHAIAEHEHIPDIVAAELGNYLVSCSDGVPRIKRIILEDIENAVQRGRREHAWHLKLVLKYFIETHPASISE